MREVTAKIDNEVAQMSRVFSTIPCLSIPGAVQSIEIARGARQQPSPWTLEIEMQRISTVSTKYQPRTGQKPIEKRRGGGEETYLHSFQRHRTRPWRSR